MGLVPVFLCLSFSLSLPIPDTVWQHFPCLLRPFFALALISPLIWVHFQGVKSFRGARGCHPIQDLFMEGFIYLPFDKCSHISESGAHTVSPGTP